MEREGIWNLIAKKLSGEASPEELRELEIRMRQDPDLQYSIQAVYDLWETRPNDELEKKQSFHAFWRHLERMQALGIEYPAREPGQEEKETEQNPIPRTGKKHVFSAVVLSLVILAAFFALGTAIFKSQAPAIRAPAPEEGNSEITTRNGSRTNLLLPDGTRVWINAGSRLDYDKNYGVSMREIRLEGEAFFDVARNPQKPFIIHTDRMDIRVLGTSFNIRSYPSDKTTEATLVHGSIEVSVRNRPGSAIILKPNEKLIVIKEDSALQKKTPTNPGAAASDKPSVTIRKPTYEQNTGTLIETSWVDNRLIFQDQEFGILAKDLERWYGVSIRFTEPAQQKWRFTGTFQKETIEQALDALKMTAVFTYTIHGTEISIFTKK